VVTAQVSDFLQDFCGVFRLISLILIADQASYGAVYCTAIRRA
jgi:hypothetical protein